MILVTGCASGIGLALAEKLYDIENYRTVITARPRSIAKLTQKFKEKDNFLIRPLDVCDPISMTVLLAEINKTWGPINILVNNAGISYRSVIEHMTEAEEYEQMATNYLGPMSLIRKVLPDMRKIGRGKIINISSVSGMLAMPTMASYSASKYALEGASEALWYEVRPFGIDVSLVQPGFINSTSYKKIYYSRASHPIRSFESPYQDFYRNMIPFIEKLMRWSSATPEGIAKLIIHTIRKEQPPLWIPATLDAVLFYYMRRWIPRRWLLPFLFLMLPNANKWAKNYSQKRVRPLLTSSGLDFTLEKTKSVSEK